MLRITVTYNKKTQKWEVRKGGSNLSSYRLKSDAVDHANKIKAKRGR